MCLKGLRLGVLSHFVWKSGHFVSAPSLYKESTDSLIQVSIPLQDEKGVKIHRRVQIIRVDILYSDVQVLPTEYNGGSSCLQLLVIERNRAM